MGEEKNDNKDVDSDVEDVTTPDGPIELSDDNNDDEICEPEHLRKLFIGGLAGQTDEETLRKFYRKWGTVVDTVVMRDSTTKRSRGFGFVTYSKVVMVDKAQSNRPHIIDGRTVESKRALPRPENQPSEPKKGPSVKKLFVGGLKDLHDEKCLKEYFSEFGNVLSVQILVDNNTGKRRGFALVEYDDYDAVDKAILQKTHLVSNILLDVKKTVYVQDTKKKFTEKTEERNQKNGRTEGVSKGGSYTDRMPPRPNQGENHATSYRNMMPRGPPIPPHAAPYQQGPQPYQQPQTYQPTQTYQQPQQQYPQMPSYQQGPQPNYNQWGPPQPPTPYAQPPTSYPQHPPAAVTQQQRPMPPQNYAGYGPPANVAPAPAHPPPPQAPNWNTYAPAANANTWSAPLPPPQPPAAVQPPASNWQNNQWGPPPSVAPPTAMPPGNQAPPNWQQQPVGPPPQQQPPGPGMYQQPQPQQLPPPPPPPPNMFGSGYQQNYGGGPSKPPSTYTNRMNPYGAPSNQYNNNPPPPGYGNGMPNGNRYRR